MSSFKIYKRLDLTSSSCAGPIGELSGVMDEVNPGEAVEVIVADEATKKDIITWANRRRFKVVDQGQENGKFKLLVGK
ncbi:MAG: sulfurtransferase TusA family protein [Sulfolobaceae archaeon]|nr:sulfurtransferase TusA family protein [Sulfolobaceae archaeon]